VSSQPKARILTYWGVGVRAFAGIDHIIIRTFA